MDDKQDWQEFLNESYHSLARVIRPQCFYSYLRSKNVFNLSDQEYVEKTYVTTVMKAGCLIDTIMTKGEPGFKAFMEIVEYKYPELFQTITGRLPRSPPKEFSSEWRSKITSVTDSLGLLMKCLGPLQESLMEKQEAFRDLEKRILTLKEENEECSQQLLAQIEMLKQQIDNLNNDKEILEKDLTFCRQSEQNYKKLYEDMRTQRDKEQERSIQLRERCDVMGSRVNNLNVEIETERQRSIKKQTAANDTDDKLAKEKNSTSVNDKSADKMALKLKSLNDDFQFIQNSNKQLTMIAEQSRIERDRYISAFKKAEEELEREKEKNKKLTEECEVCTKKYKEVIERVENLEKEMEEQLEKQISESPDQKIFRNKYSKKESLPKILREKTGQTTNEWRFATIGASPLVVFAPKEIEKELRIILSNSIKPYPIEITRSEEEMNMYADNSDILYSTALSNNSGYCCIRYSSLFKLNETCLVTVPCECVFRMIKNNIRPIICLVKFLDMGGFSELNREEERFEKEDIKYHTLFVDVRHKTNVREIANQILPEIQEYIRENK